MITGELGKRRRVTFKRGYDRTGGYYGRYAGRDGELKFHDVALDDVVVTNTAAITASINLIAQGITESTRVGRKCSIKAIQWRYRVSMPLQDAIAVPITSDTLRIIMYVDKQCNGAAAAFGVILENNDWQSFRSLANSGRFNILMDKNITVNYLTLSSDNAAVSSQGVVIKEGTFYKKCDIPLEFDDITGAVTEIRSNNIGVLLISASGIIGFQSQLRLRFSDQ